MEYILAIDHGTTGTRAILFDKHGNNKASAYKEFTQYFPKPGWVEHDPKDIWKSVLVTINAVLRQQPKAKIQSIGITNQRETTIVWDKETSQPIYPAIVWQCRRTAPRCEQLKREKGLKTLIKKKTGLPIDAYFSATKLEWILKHVKNAADKARKGQLLFGTTDTWILWKLTKGAVHATDYTNASRTMLFHIEKKQWDAFLLKKFHVPKIMLPEVKPSSTLFGYTAKHRFLPAGIPITGVAGDQQAALFGQACFEPGSIKNTYGTGCFMLLNTGQKRINSRYGLITTLGCDADGQPVYILEGAIFIAGSAIQWLRDGLGLLASAPESEKMALKVKSNDGVYFVPALVGLGAPYWDQNARGCIYGITRGTTKEHMVRAALEAMCYQTKDVLDAMQKDSRLKIKALKVDGGAIANNFICQYQADLLNIKVIRPRNIEITALGAAYLAGLASGYWKSSKDIQSIWKLDRNFKPSLNPKKAKKYYQDWQQTIQRTLSTKKHYHD
ncbi:MAG: glycerol kinase GlpK [Candidatus Omnitrophica bacterium]|nr:glycerol kinase GlpK [Candidatus Omnitrophota bacterium]